MKKSIVILIMTFLLLFGSGITVQAATPQISADGAILIDSVTGDVLWEQNGYQDLPPASTTKILTALLALDLNILDRTTTVSESAAAVGESSAGLTAGEVFDVENLLRGALVKSANDACFAIGEAAVGTEPLYVHLLEIKAQSLGGYTSQLANTNGLPAENHLLSPYTLAMAARAALSYDFFRETVASKTIVMEGGSYNRTFKNTNKLLNTEGVIGIKTGTTNDAGACLVSAMNRDDREVIAVVLHSSDRYGDSLELLEYGIQNFENFNWLTAGEEVGFYPDETSQEGGVWAVAANDGLVTVAKGKSDMQIDYSWRQLPEDTQITAGMVLGEARLLDTDGTVLSRVQLVSADSLYYSFGRLFCQKLLTDIKGFCSSSTNTY